MSAENDPNNDNQDFSQDQDHERSVTDILLAESDALRAEIAAMKDRALRALAESENTRKRMEREKSDATQYAITKFARDLLSVADNLQRALTAFPPDVRANVEPGLKAVIEGVDATDRELLAVLGRNDIKSINPVGEKFDPHQHQAIAEVPASGQAPGTVVTVVQNGYLIGDRLLRPAMVTVAKTDGGGQSHGAAVDTTV